MIRISLRKTLVTIGHVIGMVSKILRRAARRIERMGNKLRYRLLGAKITDGAFLQALSDNFPTAEQFARHIASDGKSRFS